MRCRLQRAEQTRETTVYVIFLKFSDNKAAAQEFMTAHNDWIAKGFADGVFQIVGSLSPAGGGAVIAHGESRDAIETRVNADPFVVHDVVRAEIHEIAPKKTAHAFDFLQG